MSPLPDVSGLPPDQAETLMAQWQTDFEQYGKDLEIWKAYVEAQEQNEHENVLAQAEIRADGYLQLERKKKEYQQALQRYVDSNTRRIEEAIQETDLSSSGNILGRDLIVNALTEAQKEIVADYSGMIAEVEAKQAEIMQRWRQ